MEWNLPTGGFYSSFHQRYNNLRNIGQWGNNFDNNSSANYYSHRIRQDIFAEGLNTKLITIK